MTELQERKRLLILQSDLHRALLRAECEAVRERLGWMAGASEKVRAGGAWIGVGAALLGFVAAWRGRKLARWVPALFAGWRALRRFRGG